MRKVSILSSTKHNIEIHKMQPGQYGIIVSKGELKDYIVYCTKSKKAVLLCSEGDELSTEIIIGGGPPYLVNILPPQTTILIEV